MDASSIPLHNSGSTFTWNPNAQGISAESLFLLFGTAPVDVAHNIASDVQMVEIIQQYLMCIRIIKAAAASVHINSQLQCYM